MPYPKREGHFAHRFCRLLFKSCAAQEIGLDAVALLTAIAHTEDAKRYSGPVTYYNEQLQQILGVRKWDRLDRIRKAAIRAGWLHYESPGKRKPGVYWVRVPKEFGGLDDAPSDEGLYPLDGYKQGYQDGLKAAQSHPPEGMNQGIKRGQTGGQSGGKPGYEPGDKGGEPSIAPYGSNPSPSPSPSPKRAAKAKAKKSKSQVTLSDLSIPAALDTDECRNAATAWIDHHRKIGKPYRSADGMNRLLRQWARDGPEAFTAAVDHSIAQNYQGLYSPKGGPNGSSSRSGANRAGLRYDPNAKGGGF